MNFEDKIKALAVQIFITPFVISICAGLKMGFWETVWATVLASIIVSIIIIPIAVYITKKRAGIYVKIRRFDESSNVFEATILVWNPMQIRYLYSSDFGQNPLGIKIRSDRLNSEVKILGVPEYKFNGCALNDRSDVKNEIETELGAGRSLFAIVRFLINKLSPCGAFSAKFKIVAVGLNERLSSRFFANGTWFNVKLKRGDFFDFFKEDADFVFVGGSEKLNVIAFNDGDFTNKKRREYVCLIISTLVYSMFFAVEILLSMFVIDLKILSPAILITILASSFSICKLIYSRYVPIFVWKFLDKFG